MFFFHYVSLHTFCFENKNNNIFKDNLLGIELQAKLSYGRIDVHGLQLTKA